MKDEYVVYILLSISQLYCYAYAVHRVIYYKRKSFRSHSIDLVAGCIYGLFSLYYNVEFWTYGIMSCKVAHAFAVAGVSLVGPAFFMQICDLYYTRALHSVENFIVKEFNWVMSLYKRVHDHLLYAVLFFICNAAFLLAVLMPIEYPSYDGLWIDDECMSHSRTYSVIVPKYIFILGNFVLSILLYRWKEGQEFRLYMMFSMIAIGSATVVWSFMFELVSEQASTLPYIWVCSFWIYLLTKYGHIVSKEDLEADHQAHVQGFVDDIPNSIEEVFARPEYLQYWKQLVAIEFSTENTLCYLDLQKLSDITPEVEYKLFLDTYIRVNSVYEVNLSDTLRKRLLEETVLSSEKRKLLKHELSQLMRADTLSRFSAFVKKQRAAKQHENHPIVSTIQVQLVR